MFDIISKVCSIPRDFHFYQNKSITQLLQESGYLEQPEAVTKERLIEHLTANPDLLIDWENYSSDKRYSPAWYFKQENSEWIVGYFDQRREREQVFSSGFEACAEFILYELKEFAKRATRR